MSVLSANLDRFFGAIDTDKILRELVEEQLPANASFATNLVLVSLLSAIRPELEKAVEKAVIAKVKHGGKAA